MKQMLILSKVTTEVVRKEGGFSLLIVLYQQWLAAQHE